MRKWLAILGVLLVCGCSSTPLDGKPATIVLLRDEAHGGQILVDGKIVSASELTDEVVNHALEDNPTMIVADVLPHAQIVIRADSGVRFGALQEVLGRLTREGFQNICVAVANGHAECSPSADPPQRPSTNHSI